MSFEEKYHHYKKTDRFSAPDGYVDDIAGRVSEKITERRTVPALRVWSLSLSAVAVLALGWFLYPVLTPAPETAQPGLAQHRTAQHSLAQVPDIIVPETPFTAPPRKDTGTYVATNDAPSATPTLNDLSKEDIMEYLLDEGFEEI